MVVVVLWFARVAVLVGAEVVVVVFVTCRTLTTGSAGCDGVFISVCHSSSEACNFTIAFCVCSGNSLDQVYTQLSSMQASCASIFFDCVHIFFCQCKCGGVCKCGSSCSCSNGHEMFLAFVDIFHGFLPDVVHCFLECRKSMENGLTVIDISTVLVLGYGVLWCSDTQMGSGALKQGFLVLVTGYSDGF